jgi:hypothetical protein
MDDCQSSPTAFCAGPSSCRSVGRRGRNDRVAKAVRHPDHAIRQQRDFHRGRRQARSRDQRWPRWGLSGAVDLCWRSRADRSGRPASSPPDLQSGTEGCRHVGARFGTNSNTQGDALKHRSALRLQPMMFDQRYGGQRTEDLLQHLPGSVAVPVPLERLRPSGSPNSLKQLLKQILPAQ